LVFLTYYFFSWFTCLYNINLRVYQAPDRSPPSYRGFFGLSRPKKSPRGDENSPFFVIPTQIFVIPTQISVTPTQILVIPTVLFVMSTQISGIPTQILVTSTETDRKSPKLTENPPRNTEIGRNWPKITKIDRKVPRSTHPPQDLANLALFRSAQPKKSPRGDKAYG
jgi:hypothetical protein